ncbi:MAG: CHASE2 domain-containing protein [Erysipelotrichaceae bacterium]|nr:CHASE2 domain-containing protein [Erysipelotrichaceae bacterium]
MSKLNKEVFKEKLLPVIMGIFFTALAFFITLSMVFYNTDKIFSDKLYQGNGVPANNIKIIAIDEKTIAEYGDVSSWSRDIYGKLLDKLNENSSPAVIGFDLLFVDNKAGDEEFVEACKKYKNVVSAINVVYKTKVDFSGDKVSIDKENIDLLEYPFNDLKKATDSGFVIPILIAITV